MRRLGKQQKTFMRILYDLEVFDGRDVTIDDIAVCTPKNTFKTRLLAKNLLKYELFEWDGGLEIVLTEAGKDYAKDIDPHFYPVAEKLKNQDQYLDRGDIR